MREPEDQYAAYDSKPVQLPYCSRLPLRFMGALAEGPMRGLVAPAIPKSALPGGDSDLTAVLEIMRFATPANLTGLPAGMQAIGRAWQEPGLLRLALEAEQVVERRSPQVRYALLDL